MWSSAPAGKNKNFAYINSVRPVFASFLFFLPSYDLLLSSAALHSRSCPLYSVLRTSLTDHIPVPSNIVPLPGAKKNLQLHRRQGFPTFADIQYQHFQSLTQAFQPSRNQRLTIRLDVAISSCAFYRVLRL